jgi:zinc and cadmium transporter
MLLLLILLSTFLVSIISLIGVFTFILKENLLSRLLFYFVGFSAGALIGAAFLDVLPEALEHMDSRSAFYFVILGLVIFFVVEKYLHWRHCHHGHSCHVSSFTYLNLVGESFHNFLDGVMIAAAFVVSRKLGIVTTLAVILHEIPHELGNFCVLVYGGFSRKKALFCNFFSACMSMVGALLGFFLADKIHGFTSFILPLTAGGFIYIAACDLIPELHKENATRRSSLAFLAFVSGIALMALTTSLLHG